MRICRSPRDRTDVVLVRADTAGKDLEIGVCPDPRATSTPANLCKCTGKHMVRRHDQLGNKSADIYLVDGDRDATCPAWQTEKLAGALRNAGYQVEHVQLDDANHSAPVFHDIRNGPWQVITDDPAGQQTVQVIVDAVAAAHDTPPAD